MMTNAKEGSKARIIGMTDLECPTWARSVAMMDPSGDAAPGGTTILLHPDWCVYWREGWSQPFSMRELMALASVLQFVL